MKRNVRIRRARFSRGSTARNLACALGVALFVGGVQAASETQVLSFDYSGGPPPQFTIEKFDSQGGTRTLTGVTISFDATSSLDVFAENQSDAPVDDWFVDLAVLPRFELLDAKKSSFGLGGSGFPQLMADLGPSDGVPGSGEDFIQFPTVSVKLHSHFDLFPQDVALFDGGGTVDGLLALPLSIAIPPLPVAFDLTRNDVGALTITYQYVPEPSVLSLLTFGGLLFVRRR